MNQAQEFVFDRTELSEDRRTVTCHYSVLFQDDSPISFREVITFPVALPGDQVTQKLLDALLLGLGISYYKAHLAPKFITPRHLSELEAAFWNQTYRNGLGEFLLVNRIEPSRLAVFEADPAAQNQPAVISGLAPSAILALGGGKDSIVAGELLKAMNIPVQGYVLGTSEHHGQTERVAAVMGVELLGVNRQIDPALLELNKQPGIYNGHVPISMIFALCGLLLANASQSRYLVVGNESSASLPNTEWHGMSINHQWSKSFEFETQLLEYIHKTISPDLWYLSAIRPLNSVAVSQIFSRFPNYLQVFTSCNRVFRIDPSSRPNGRWCGTCAKCLSSFIILAPWLGEATTTQVFGENLLDNTELEQLFRELAGLEGHRPLDCVGTADEIRLSLTLMAGQGQFASSPLMVIARQVIVPGSKVSNTDVQAYTEPATEYRFPPEIETDLLATTRLLLHG